MVFRSFLSLLGVLLALPILMLIALAFTLPITLSGIGYLFAGVLVIAGLILAPWDGRAASTLVAIGLIGLAFVAGVRLLQAARDDNSNPRVITLPQGQATRWINSLIDEQDSLIFGEAIFHRIGGDSRREHEGLTDALYTTYSEMRRTRPVFASPFLSTYLNLQRSTSFDAVVIEPVTRRRQDMAVIFLHGYMGNVAAQCWEIAQAVEKIGALTVCPSTDWTGQWWQPEGEAILEATFQYLREQGIEEFSVGGFSNGGFGISRMVSTLSNEDGVRGLFFINGIHDGESIRETGLPILIIQGMQDERVPAEFVRPIASAIGELGTYVELEGDHFMIMKQPKAVQNAISDWLHKQEPDQ